MSYVGLDVHWKQSTFCVLDGNGRHLRTRAIRGTWDKVLPELAKVKRPFAICFQATSGYGHLHEKLKQDSQTGRGGPSGAAQADLSIPTQERSGRCDEAGEAAVPGRGAPCTCAFRRRAGLAWHDRVPLEARGGEDAGEEQVAGAASARK